MYQLGKGREGDKMGLNMAGRKFPTGVKDEGVTYWMTLVIILVIYTPNGH
jgi:hypothetical protein